MTEKIKSEKWVAEWDKETGSYRVYETSCPERTIAYDDDIENIYKQAKKYEAILQIKRG